MGFGGGRWGGRRGAGALEGKSGGGTGWRVGGERIHCRACHVRWAPDRNLQRISQGAREGRRGSLHEPKQLSSAA